MEVSGSAPANAGLSTYTTAGRTYSRKQMGFRAISAAASSRIVKAISGSPPREDSTGFESFLSLRCPRNRASPATRLCPCSRPRMGASGLPPRWPDQVEERTSHASSTPAVDCRMTGRSLSSRMIVVESGCSRVAAWRIWNDDRFVGVPGVPSKEVFSMMGDGAGGLWLSTHKSLLHMRDGRLVEDFHWPVMGRHQQATVVVPDQGGVWLAFWSGGGVLYFERWQGPRIVHTRGWARRRPGCRPCNSIARVRCGPQHRRAASAGSKMAASPPSRPRNGLPCDTIHWSMEDEDRSLWLYAACGLVRITRTELDAWIADPKRRIETAVWDAADGVRLSAVTAPPTILPSRSPPMADCGSCRRRGPGRRSPSSSFQQSPAAGAYREGLRRREAPLATPAWRRRCRT